MERLGQYFNQNDVLVLSINIPSSFLYEPTETSDGILRKDYITEFFADAKCKHYLFPATTREVAQRDDPEYVSYMDGYLGRLRRLVKDKYPTTMSATDFEKDFRARMIDLMSKYEENLSNDECFEFEEDDLFPPGGVDFREVNQEELKKELKDLLRNKQARSACSMSHLRALKYAKNQFDQGEIKMVFITEDDIKWNTNKPATELVEMFISVMGELESRTWDMVMLGSSNYPPDNRKTIVPQAYRIKGSKNRVRINFSYGNYALLVNGSSIDKMIDIVEKSIVNGKKNHETFAQDVAISDEMMHDGRLKVFGPEFKLFGAQDGPAPSIICDKYMNYSAVCLPTWNYEVQE